MHVVTKLFHVLATSNKRATTLDSPLDEMEQIIINVKQATRNSVETLICSACTAVLRDDLLKSDDFIFTLHSHGLSPQRAPAPKFSGLFPSRQKPKWPLMTPCKQRVTGDKLLKHFPASLFSSSLSFR